MNQGHEYVRATETETGLVEAVLSEIKNELSRNYWNLYQREMLSPFDNTGERYECGAFCVMAYKWSDVEGEADVGRRKPNFAYPSIRVTWYKHLGRGTTVETEESLTVKFLSEMLDACKKAIHSDFEGRKKAMMVDRMSMPSPL